MRFNSLVLLVLFIGLSFTFTHAQACGKSVRTIFLKFETNSKPPKLIKYDLFYLAPKGTGKDYNNYERTGKFLSQFLYDNPDAEKGQFWLGYKEENPFIKVPAKKAEDYIKTYKLLDFKDFYTNPWYDNHLSQLNGSFQNGKLKLETRETDITPFIMRIKFPKYENLYLVSSFLGGCFNGQPIQTVEMKVLPVKKGK